MATNYHDLWTSVFAKLKSMIETFESEALTDKMTVCNFDAVAEIEEFPDNDLIGVRNFGIQQVHGKLYEVVFLATISTVDDTNLKRLEQMIGVLFDEFSVGRQINLLNSDTGNTQGQLTVMDGTEVLPVLNTRARAVKAIAVRLSSDRTGP